MEKASSFQKKTKAVQNFFCLSVNLLFRAELQYLLSLLLLLSFIFTDMISLMIWSMEVLHIRLRKWISNPNVSYRQLWRESKNIFKSGNFEKVYLSLCLCSIWVTPYISYPIVLGKIYRNIWMILFGWHLLTYTWGLNEQSLDIKWCSLYKTV